MLNKIVFGNGKYQLKNILHLIIILMGISQMALAQNPTISGEITYPGHEQDYPNGEIFIDVWQNPTQWPYPPEAPNLGFPLGPPVDFNNSVSYVIDNPILQVGSQYYVMVSFDEDNTQQPSMPEAEGYWGTDLTSGAIDLSGGSISGINVALQPIGGVGGIIEGTVSSSESVTGDLWVGLFEPTADPNYWDQRSADIPLGNFVFPQYNLHFSFQQPFIVDGGGYFVTAFVDEDFDGNPDPNEIWGMSPSILVSGGYGNSGDIFLKYGAGGGFSFDFGATGGYAETNFTILDGGPQITMEAFIQLHSPIAPGELYEFIHRENWGFLDYVGDGGTFRFSLANIGEINWQYTPNPGEWHHIAADYDGVNMNLYWDGELKASIPANGNLLTNPYPMRFGEGFDGLADIIRISDVALYQGNNFDPWTQNYSPNTNTFLLYNCNEGSGNQLIDESGHGHDADITGTPTWDPDEPFGPQGLKLWVAGSGPNYIDLNWDRWPDLDQDFARYELHRNNVGGVTLSDPVVLDEYDVNVVSWRDNNVTAGNTYYYKLWMYDQVGVRFETNEVVETPGGTEGRIAGVINLNEDWAPGQVHLDLWFPGNDPNTTSPNLSQQWGEDPPFSVGYLFEDPGIYQGGPYNIRAYFDANSNGQFDEGEPKGGADNLYVPSSNELAPVDIELTSQPVGHVEGNIHSDAFESGQLIIGLFDPLNSGDEWDPNLQIDFGVTFPSDQFYQFDDPAIYDAGGWQVKAFLDQNANWIPDGNELYGESGQFTISSGFADQINFTLDYPPPLETGSISGNIITSRSADGNLYIGLWYPGSDPSVDNPDQSIGPNYVDFPNAGATFPYNFTNLPDGSGYVIQAFLDQTGSSTSGVNECDQGEDLIGERVDIDVVGGGATQGQDVNLVECDQLGGLPVVEVSTTQLNYYYGNTSLDFTVGNVGEDTVYWTIEVNYLSAASGWITSITPNSGQAANPDEVTVTVKVNPTGSVENAQLIVHGYSDQELSQAVNEDTIDVYLDEWHSGTGKFDVESDHIYLVAEEGARDTVSIFFKNLGNGSILISGVRSHLPTIFYPDPSDTVTFPWPLHPGKIEDVSMILAPTGGTIGQYEGQLEFELENAGSSSHTIDVTIDVLSAGSVVIRTAHIDSITMGIYDLTTNYMIAVNMINMQVESGEVTITLVDGAIPPANPSGDTSIAVASRYWEIFSDLEPGTFAADLCFDLSDFGGGLMSGINDFGGLKIFKRVVFSDDSWIPIPDNELSYDEQNNTLCAMGQSTFSQWTVGSDSSGTNFVPALPEVTLNIPGVSAKENNPINLDITATAEAGLKELKLKYWVGGEGTIRNGIINSLGGDTYRGIIPAEHVTNKGLIGFVSVQDSLNRIVTTDTTEIRVEFDSIFIHVINPKTYTMISVPGELNLKTVSPVLFETYDKTQFRIFRWKNNGYQEFPGVGPLDPGKAFWVISRDRKDLQGGVGTSTQLLPPIEINLYQGWNQIGTPYNFGNEIGDLVYPPGAIEPTFYEFDGSGYRTVNIMEPGKGYWIFAYANTSVKVRHIRSNLPRHQGMDPLVTLDWGGLVKASVGGLIDHENIFGVTPNASNTWDELDRHEPPVIGDYITLAFDNRKWESRGGLYSQDIQKGGSEGYLWQFVVKTNQEGTVYLSVEKMGEFPQEWQSYMIDIDLGMVHDLKNSDSYRFVSQGSEVERNFSLVAGPPSFTKDVIKEYELIPEDYILKQNIPNPFNAITTIQFGLPEGGKVHLTIYDILGQKVATIISNREFPAGSHAVLWNGKDDSGHGVSTGIYFYDLTVQKDGIMKFHQARKLVLLK